MSVILYGVVDGGVQALGQLGAAQVECQGVDVGKINFQFIVIYCISVDNDAGLDAPQRDLGLLQREGYGLGHVLVSYQNGGSSPG
jgi:hypothetical protein